MVSSLWKACQDGDAAKIEELLNDASSIDIEIKDHTGVTPLIQAVKGGHVHIVKSLLAKGADPTNASAQGRPETYTSDPHILQVLAAARGEPVMSYPDPAQYYAYPQYAPYPGYPEPPPSWYPMPPPPPHQQQQQQQPQEGEHAANLPPPEVARNIPCRYYPACRYGSACVFAHPQAPYFPGSLPPPAQYGPPPNVSPPPPPQHPHYDPNMPMPPPAPYPYYPMSPPFSPGHMRTHSDVLSPPPFSPTHLPVPVPVPVQYLPPPPHPPPMSPSYPMPPSAYPRRGSVTSPASYPSPIALDPAAAPPPGDVHPQGQAQMNGNANGGNMNGVNGRQRRGSAAGYRGDGGRPSYGGRKPPCLFFPSGRCRNGEECRFPHVMPENGAPPPHGRGHTHFPARSRAGTGPGGGYYREGGYGGLEERMAGLSVRDNNASHEGTVGTSTPSAKPAANGSAKAHHPAQGQQQRQRVPGADEFPVLQPNGHAHPPVNGHSGPSSVNGTSQANGWANAVNGTGPTAAQILRESSRGPSPLPGKELKPTPTAPENLASKPAAEVQVSA